MITKLNFKDLITLILIVGVFIFAFIIIKPIVIPIIYGILLAYILYPVYKFVLKKLKYENLSALIVGIGLLIIIIGLSFLIFETLFRQVIEFYLNLQKLDFSELGKKILPDFISSTDISSNVLGYLNNYISNLTADFLKIFRGFITELPVVFLKIFIVIFVFFFSLRDGERAIIFLKSISPLKKETEDKFFNHLTDITSSVLIGQIVVGIIQGICAGIGYFIFGVPNALLLTFLTIITSMIPIVGAWIVWVPVDIYLFAIGNTGAGIGLLIYGILVISTIDNIIRLFILSRKTKISSVILLIGTIGGMFAFGFLGLIIGPLVLAYVLLIAELYRKNTLGDSLIFTESVVK